MYIKKDATNIPQEKGINSILFWGGMCALLGFFSHYIGIYMAMQEIRKASDISPAVLAGGYQVSLIPILSGLFILTLASIIWYVLRSKLNKINE
jgi:biopolymer transport protein ExbB/TolQ